MYSRWPGLLAVEALAFVCLYMVCLYSVVEPRWETNDDIAMSMVAHGYGIAAVSSPTIVFSNVIWGYIVTGFPAIGAIPGYSAATIGVLVLVASFLYWLVVRNGYGRTTAVLVIALVFTRPFVYPQFTLNSGLLCIGAFMALHRFKSERNMAYALIAVLMATLSFLVRSQEFLLVALVSMPLLPWRAFLVDRALRATLLLITIIVVSAAALDVMAYRTADWAFYNDLNPLRAAFTDFSASDAVKAHAAVLAKYKFTVNDIELLRNWFFADRSIADPAALRGILSDIGVVELRSSALSDGYYGLSLMFGIRLLPLMIVAAAAAILFTDWRLLFSLASVIALGLIISALGRLDTLRIYEPLLALTVVALLVQTADLRPLRRVWLCVVAVAAVVTVWAVTETSLRQQTSVNVARESSQILDGSQVVLWGAGLPLEAIYPVLDRQEFKRPVALYSLGTFTWAPFSVAYDRQRAGQGLVEQLRSDQGIWIIGTGANFQSLEIYCREHFGADLEEIEHRAQGPVRISRRRCTKTAG